LSGRMGEGVVAADAGGCVFSGGGCHRTAEQMVCRGLRWRWQWAIMGCSDGVEVWEWHGVGAIRELRTQMVCDMWTSWS